MISAGACCEVTTPRISYGEAVGKDHRSGPFSHLQVLNHTRRFYESVVTCASIACLMVAASTWTSIALPAQSSSHCPR